MPFKLKPIRLNDAEYRLLAERVLERDGYRCQQCGSMQTLEVHHQIFRSHGGADDEKNLITLCRRCHTHRHKPPASSMTH